MWRLSSIPRRCFSVAICMLLCLAAPALSRADSSLTFMPIEESKYLLKGTGFEEIAAITFTVDYDTTYLFAPDVVVMGGRLQEEDRGAGATPGNLQLHILNDDRSAVFEATIYFQKRGDYPAVINFVTAEVADPSGSLRPVPVEMVTPPHSPDKPEQAEARPAPEPGAERLLQELVAQTVGPSPAASPAAPPLPQGDGALPAPAEADNKTAAERFRDFSGKKGLAAFTALLSGAGTCCRQTPPVLISDGRRTARVVVSGVEGVDGPPLFSVSGGGLVSVQRGANEEEWIAVVRPREDAWDVRVRCIAANDAIDFPLTAAPAIGIPSRKLAELNEKTFMPNLRRFLSGKPGRGRGNSPEWFREYLFTANYLAAREERKGNNGNKTPAAGKP